MSEQSRTEVPFTKAANFRSLNVAAPGDGRTPYESFLRSPQPAFGGLVMGPVPRLNGAGPPQRGSPARRFIFENRIVAYWHGPVGSYRTTP